MPAVPRFDSVTIDCPDPAALARFYGELLEWPVPAPAGDAEYVAIALGARLLDTQEKFRVYADPVGHPFCLCSW